MIRWILSLVGRAGFEPATNGLKARYAHRARSTPPLCTQRIRRSKSRFLPRFCQILPTSAVAAPALASTLTLGGQTPESPTYTAYESAAWAIGSITWQGTEFLDCFDHGRCLQSAVSFDGMGESNNPTQAGSYADGLIPRPSSSRPLLLQSGPYFLGSKTQMAYWSGGLSSTVHWQVTAVSWQGRPGVAKHFIGFTLPNENHSQAQFEILTGYMPATFSRFRTYDPATKTLADLNDGPGEQALPIIFCTQDDSKCMGVLSASPLAGGGYGRWRFIGSTCMTSAGPTGCVKWNAVSRLLNPTPGATYNFTLYTFVGALGDVVREIDRTN